MLSIWTARVSPSRPSARTHTIAMKARIRLYSASACPGSDPRPSRSFTMYSSISAPSFLQRLQTKDAWARARCRTRPVNVGETSALPPALAGEHRGQQDQHSPGVGAGDVAGPVHPQPDVGRAAGGDDRAARAGEGDAGGRRPGGHGRPGD